MNWILHGEKVNGDIEFRKYIQERRDIISIDFEQRMILNTGIGSFVYDPCVDYLHYEFLGNQLEVTVKAMTDNGLPYCIIDISGTCSFISIEETIRGQRVISENPIKHIIRTVQLGFEGVLTVNEITFKCVRALPSRNTDTEINAMAI